MSERDKVAEKLRKKELEVHSLEDKLRAAKVYVQALQDVLKMLSDGGERLDALSTDVALRPGSAVDQAREIILQRGTPVHVSDLLAALGREPSRDSRASLTSSLAAYVRRGEIFTRPAPNTFGLVELGHNGSRNDANVEPPPGFGKDRSGSDASNPFLK